MTKPNESDYTSHVAYARALEEYCDQLSGLADKWNSECDEMREDNVRLSDELAKLKQQEPAAWINGFGGGPANKGIYGWSDYPIGTKFYLAAGANK